jgi:hypothetical protein
MELSILFAIIILVPLAVLIFKFPELGLVLCLVVGSFFKGLVQPLLGDIDITVYLFAVTFGSILIRCSMEKRLALPDLKINIGVLLFTGLLLASLLYTPLFEQGTDVFLRFVFLTIPIMYAAFMWCTNINRIKRLLTIFIGVVFAYSTILIVWVFLVQHGVYQGGRATFAATPALGVAQLLAAGIIIAFILRGFVSGRFKRLALYLLIIAGVVELIALNSRGPLIALAAGAVCLFFLYSPREKGRVVLLALPLLAIVVFCVLFAPRTVHKSLRIADQPRESFHSGKAQHVAICRRAFLRLVFHRGRDIWLCLLLPPGTGGVFYLGRLPTRYIFRCIRGCRVLCAVSLCLANWLFNI